MNLDTEFHTVDGEYQIAYEPRLDWFDDLFDRVYVTIYSARVQFPYFPEMESNRKLSGPKTVGCKYIHTSSVFEIYVNSRRFGAHLLFFTKHLISCKVNNIVAIDWSVKEMERQLCRT